MASDSDARAGRALRRSRVLRDPAFDPPIAQVADGLGGGVLAALRRRGLTSLSDLARWRANSGRLRGFEAAAGAQLDAQAAFAALPTTPKANDRLLAAGFATPSEVAGMTREEFLVRIGRRMPRRDALAVHDAATVRERLLANAAAAEATGAAPTTARILTPSGACRCEGCASALSPSAYLADLLDYAIRHLRRVVSGPGLRGEYFAGPFTDRRLERIDRTIDFDWGTGAPDSSLPADGFSVRWTGTIRPRYSEGYSFTIQADDGVQRARLWIDGELVVSPASFSGAGGTERSGLVVLASDEAYDLRLEYEDAGGPAQVRLFWSSFSQPREIVPAARMAAARRIEAINLQALEQRLGQPLAGLLEGCRFVEQRVHRARIAAEAVRTIIAPAQRAYSDPAYTFAMYEALLEEMGTSYAEVRRALAEGDKPAIRELALRLGITAPGLPDHLDDLLLDPKDPSVGEDLLEAVFGYASTTRSPLQEDDPGLVHRRRHGALHRRWVLEDRPPGARPDHPPVIDPDVVGAADLADNAPTISWPRTPTRPMDLLEDRQRWAQQREIDIADVFDAPTAGFPSLITDTFIDASGVEQSLLGLGLGLQVADFEALATRMRAGEDVSADLGQLRLDADAFEVLADAWEAFRAPAGLTEEDRRLVIAVFVGRGKGGQYAIWRSEEGALGIVLAPPAFRIRPPPRPGFEFPWTPKPFRSTSRQRRQWQAALRRRIAQSETLDEQWSAALDTVEERYRGLQRDRIWLHYQQTTAPPVESLDRLTDRFQIDMRAGACQRTTRVAQAIESVQGLLQGARDGLLDEPALELADPAAFDVDWRWLGAYSTWRAALRVFLHPENALKPTLRRDATPAFHAFVERVRARGSLDPATAERAALDYERHLRDICSLRFEALGRATPPEAAATAEPWHVIVARGGHTGTLYACLQDLRPDSGLQAGYVRTPWHAIPGLSSDAEVIGAVEYRAPDGRAVAGLYVRTGPPNRRTVSFLAHDGTGWSPPREAGDDRLVTTSRHDTSLPPSPARAAAGADGWPLAGTALTAALDVDGDGRTELLLLEQTLGATRRVGIARLLGGGLVLVGDASLPAEWAPPAGEPVILRTTLTQSPNRRREQLLVVATVGGQPAIGLVGTGTGAASSMPQILTTAAGNVGAWTVATGARFAAADVDGDGYDELVAIERTNSSTHRVTVLRVRESGFSLLGSQSLTATDVFGQAVGDTWHAIVRSPHAGADWLLAVSEWWGWPAPALRVLRRDPATGAFEDREPWQNALWLPGAPEPIGFATGPALSKYVWVWRTGDRMRLARLGLGGTGAEYLLTTVARTDTAVLRVAGLDWPRMTWRSESTVPAGDTPRDWTRRVDDALATGDLDGDGVDELVLISAAGEVALAERTPAAGLALHWLDRTLVRTPGGGTDGAWVTDAAATFLTADLDGDGCDEIVALRGTTASVLGGLAPRRSAGDLGVHAAYGPSGVGEFAVAAASSPRWTTRREARIADAYEANNLFHPTWVDPDLTYLDEAFYFLPVEIASRLADAGHWTAALDWLRGVYDYARPRDQRKRAHLLVLNGDEQMTFARSVDWLRDPLDPHRIARTRRDSYTRGTILVVARCLIAAADDEFTRATSESVARARERYLRALDVLDAPELDQRDPSCVEMLGTLEIKVGDDELRWIWLGARNRLERIGSASVREAAVTDVRATMTSRGAEWTRVARAVERIERAERADRRARPTDGVLARDAAARRAAERVALRSPLLGERLTNVLLDVATAGDAVHATAPDGLPTLDDLTVIGYWQTLPAPRPSYCVPVNPVVASLRRHAELSLAKLRDCRNIAGLRMRLEPYEPEAAAGPDGLPTLRRGFQPLPYRYATLVERARGLVDHARQLEVSMLSAIEAGDRARYEELRARQDIGLARGGARLRELQLAQSVRGIRSAELQRERAATVMSYYEGLVRAGTSELEDLGLGFLTGAAVLHAASAAASFVSATQAAIVEGGWIRGGAAQAVASGLSSLAAASSATSQIMATQAAFDRRAQEWNQQVRVGRVEVALGNQQVRLAEGEVTIATQERDVALLQLDHAEEVLDFLVLRRFATAELYEWMSALLEEIYRFFLQQATAMAQLAEAQLAFERQEIPPATIRADYWKPPAADPAGRVAEDRRGLTGSARLLRHLTELDEYAFRTERRKLQLTKTFSLAELDPVVFQRFRSTGVLPFRTAEELYDADFPGHYLRLVKRVRTTVIAIVPPVDGIHATLAVTGPSRTVVGGDTFETVVVQRLPESVALTSPFEATGFFELNAQPELLAPFEGLGADANWEFVLPRAANQFSFYAIADVLVTIDHTALDSPDYRDGVLRRMDRQRIGDRAFLFRSEFADAWYDLHNPDLVEAPGAPMVVSFETARTDFPPNLEEPLAIRHVALLFIRPEAATFEIDIADLALDDGSGTVRTGRIPTVDGLVSTRRASGAALMAFQGRKPVGRWTLSFVHGVAATDAALRKRFADGDIRDMLLVVTFEGQTPAWPA